MNFEKHFDLEGKHAFLSPSNPQWLRYDIEKLRSVFINRLNVQRGTELHEFAASAIKLRQKLPRSTKTLNNYVNDCIGYRMQPEQKLYYSAYCFGTADCIQFKNDLLRIFDLKTGITPAHQEQLEIYAALFCLEYSMDPKLIDLDLRLYQNDDVNQWSPTADYLIDIMEDIKQKDKELTKIRMELE